jgi:hypothetical protein
LHLLTEDDRKAIAFAMRRRGHPVLIKYKNIDAAAAAPVLVLGFLDREKVIEALLEVSRLGLYRTAHDTARKLMEPVRQKGRRRRRSRS